MGFVLFLLSFVGVVAAVISNQTVNQKNPYLSPNGTGLAWFVVAPVSSHMCCA